MREMHGQFSLLPAATHITMRVTTWAGAVAPALFFGVIVLSG